MQMYYAQIPHMWHHNRMNATMKTWATILQLIHLKFNHDALLNLLHKIHTEYECLQSI